MVECVRTGVRYVLAGSIRDDGPIVDTVTDMVAAQDRYAEALTGVGLVIVLSTMLHGIGVGNMLPAWVPVVCVDINPAVVTKLADRGSSQTIGLVTDVGLFLHQLAKSVSEGSGDADVPQGLGRRGGRRQQTRGYETWVAGLGSGNLVRPDACARPARITIGASRNLLVSVLLWFVPPSCHPLKGF